MNTKPCTCRQCQAAKRNKKTSTRRFFKRAMSKWQRRAVAGMVKNFYWA